MNLFKLAAAAAGALALGMAGAPLASASASDHVVTTTLVRPLANDCGFPTQADPGSIFVKSYSNCSKCDQTAIGENGIYRGSGRVYYCTYNPSNRLNDLHYDIVP